MNHFDLNAAASHNGGGGNQSAALAAAAAAFAAAAEQQQQGSVAAGEHNGAAQPGLTWPHNTLLGMSSPIQSAGVSTWRLPASYDYRNSTVSPATATTPIAPNGQSTELSTFAGLSAADWRGNSWSPLTPTSSTPQQQFQNLLGGSNWTSSNGILTPTPIHPNQNAANLFGLEQLMNAALNGANGGGVGGGTVAEMSSPVFRTPGHLNGGIKHELGASGAHVRAATNGTHETSEMGVNVSNSTVAINFGDDTRHKVDHDRVNQNKLAALRLEEKIRAETEALRLAANNKNLLPAVPLPTVPVSPTAPFVPEVLPKEEHTIEDTVNEATQMDQPSNGNTVSQHQPQQQTGSATFSRPPGLGPIDPAEAGNGTGDNKKKYDCDLCGFSTPSRFHYNSHMNTHGDHKCKMCDYTSRTEGRLKKHMVMQHTQAQREAVGYVETRVASHQRTSESPEVGADVALEQMKALAERPTYAEQFDLGSDLPGPSNVNTSNVDAEGHTTNGNGNGSSPPKPKQVRKQRTKRLICKHCDHVSSTQREHWSHKQTHIPKSRQMPCPRPDCDFMTGYKHHLDYHIKNHEGVKPFFCTKCTYRCVNKSMLNSHMKSHSDWYMFRCLDCTYAAKHSHSLHTHLQKYGHRRMPREMVERENGMRGEHDESGGEGTSAANGDQSTEQASSVSALLPPTSSIDLSVLLRPTEPAFNTDLLPPTSTLENFPTSLRCGLCGHMSASHDELVHHITFQHLKIPGFNMERPIPASAFVSPSDILGPPPVLQPQVVVPDSSAQDTNETMDVDDEPQTGRERSHSEDSIRTFTSSEAESTTAVTGSKKRKHNKAVKLDIITQRIRDRGTTSHSNSDEHSDEIPQPASNCSSLGSNNSSTTTGHSSEARREAECEKAEDIHEEHPTSQTQDEWRFVCKFCEMAFQDRALYVIHRDYHSRNSPFTCSRCSHQCSDKFSFNVHLMAAKHD